MSHLQVYDFELTTLGPVHIGSGQVIGKKDYIKERNHLVFLDTPKMIRDLIINHNINSYQDFISDPDDHQSLRLFLRNKDYTDQRILEWEKYRVQIGNPGINNDINTFMRDAYGLPYVPGSSLKGVLRTCLAADYFKNNLADADEIADLIYEEDNAVENRRINPKTYHEGTLRYPKANKQISIKAFHRQITDIRERGTELNQMVNDTMRGLIVSDSKPLRNEDLCICQKIDKSLFRESEPLMIRECIKPGVKICFTITVDPYLFQHVDDDIQKNIQNAINAFYKDYKKVWVKAFRDMVKAERDERIRRNERPPLNSIPFIDVENNTDPDQDVLFLGGGVGYVSKTLTYNVFNDVDEANDEVKFILDKLFHNHRSDPISPRKMKCTKFNGKDYQFGPCAITRFEKIN